MKVLEKNGSVSLGFTQGSIEDHGEETYLETFGPPPNLRFYQDNLIPSSRTTPANDSVDALVRSYDTDRGGDFPAQASVRKALSDVQSVLDKEGPFHGVIGFSEGGSLAAAVLAQDQARQKDGLPNHRLQCGIFFNSYPPFTSDGKKLMLSDEFGQLIQVPSLHVVSSCDNFYAASQALAQLCSQPTVYEHDEGHRIPWKPQAMRPLRDQVHRFVESVHMTE